MSEPDAGLTRSAVAKMAAAAADHGIDLGLVIDPTTRPPAGEPIRVRHMSGWPTVADVAVPNPLEHEALKGAMINVVLDAARAGERVERLGPGFVDPGREQRWAQLAKQPPVPPDVLAARLERAVAHVDAGGHIVRWVERVAAGLHLAAFDAGVPVLFGVEVTHPESGYQACRWIGLEQGPAAFGSALVRMPFLGTRPPDKEVAALVALLIEAHGVAASSPDGQRITHLLLGGC